MFVGAKRAPGAELGLMQLCHSLAMNPQLISLFLTPWGQWMGVWQQAVLYIPLNFSPDPGSWWQLQHFGIELWLSNWPR